MLHHWCSNESHKPKKQHIKENILYNSLSYKVQNQSSKQLEVQGCHMGKENIVGDVESRLHRNDCWSHASREIVRDENAERAALIIELQEWPRCVSEREKTQSEWEKNDFLWRESPWKKEIWRVVVDEPKASSTCCNLRGFPMGPGEERRCCMITHS